MNNKNNKPRPFMTYQERLRGYEKDKKLLLATMAHLPAKEFGDKLKELQDKWNI